MKTKNIIPFIHPVVPVLNETRQLVIYFNQYLKAEAEKLQGNG